MQGKNVFIYPLASCTWAIEVMVHLYPSLSLIFLIACVQSSPLFFCLLTISLLYAFPGLQILSFYYSHSLYNFCCPSLIIYPNNLTCCVFIFSNTLLTFNLFLIVFYLILCILITPSIFINIFISYAAVWLFKWSYSNDSQWFMSISTRLDLLFQFFVSLLTYFMVKNS